MELIIIGILILFAIYLVLVSIGAWIIAFSCGGGTYFVVVLLLGIISTIIAAIVAKIIKKGTYHEKRMYIKAQQADQAAQEQYQQEVNMILTKQQNEYRVIAENANMRMGSLTIQILNHQRTLSRLPGLAQQDKNKHAVTTMISYLERGKADSIKEALILYDREERERADRNANNQILWQMQQQAQEDQRKALEHMEEAQRRHNDAIRESERKRNEKIDDAIRDMKDSLRQ